MKLTIKSRLWDGQTVTFDEDEQGFIVSSRDGIVQADQFSELIPLGTFYHISLVEVSDGEALVHFLLT